mgnify:CR=1 FL=1
MIRDCYTKGWLLFPVSDNEIKTGWSCRAPFFTTSFPKVYKRGFLEYEYPKSSAILIDKGNEPYNLNTIEIDRSDEEQSEFISFFEKYKLNNLKIYY